MTSRINEMQALLDRRDEVIAKFKAVEKKFDSTMKFKMTKSKLAYKEGQDTPLM